MTSRYENKRLIVGAFINRLMSQPPTQKESSSSIKAVHDVTKECLLGLQALEIDIDNWDPINVHLLDQLMDRNTQMLWEQSIMNPRELPSSEELLTFLENRFQAMEALGPSKRVAHSSSSSLITTIRSCIACNRDHSLFQCPDFKKMTTNQKLQLVQRAKGCVNCLKVDHNRKNCPSTSNCQRCNKRHHTLLHLDMPLATKQNAISTNHLKTESTSPPSASTLITASTKEKSAVLLSTVKCKVDNVLGQQVDCRAILDNGSRVHLITQEFVKKLGLR